MCLSKIKEMFPFLPWLASQMAEKVNYKCDQLYIKLGMLPSSSFDDLRLHYRSVTEFFVLSDRMGRIRNYFKVKVN